MRTTLRFLICAAIVLSAWYAHIPAVGADDATDYANQLYQAQKEREDWQNQLQQAQKEREDWQNQLYQAQKEREDWQNQLYQAQKEREDYQKSIMDGIRRDQQGRDDYQQSIMDGIDQVQKQRDDLLNRGQNAQPGAPAAGPVGFPGTIQVRLPDPQAAVWVNGTQVRASGTVRTLATTPLEQGRDYSYEVRAAWHQGDRLFTAQQTVSVSAGGTAIAYFHRPAAGG